MVRDFTILLKLSVTVRYINIYIITLPGSHCIILAIATLFLPKVDRLTDVVTGQPMVVKMIVSFNRSGKGQDCLRDLLGPLVNRVLEDKTLHIR